MINRATSLAIAVTIAIICFILLLSQCTSVRNRAAQERVEDAQAGALQNSAGDAINTTAVAGKREAGSEELTRSNEKEIRNAPGADDQVNPGVRNAGRNALCLRDAYRNHPECRMRQPDTR